MFVDDKQARETLISQLRQFESLDENDILRDAADAIESLSAQVAELKKDAERMEFVLLHTWISDGQRLHIAFEHEYNEAMQGIALALIDRAMADAAKESGVPV